MTCRSKNDQPPNPFRSTNAGRIATATFIAWICAFNFAAPNAAFAARTNGAPRSGGILNDLQKVQKVTAGVALVTALLCGGTALLSLRAARTWSETATINDTTAKMCGGEADNAAKKIDEITAQMARSGDTTAANTEISVGGKDRPAPVADTFAQKLTELKTQKTNYINKKLEYKRSARENRKNIGPARKLGWSASIASVFFTAVGLSFGAASRTTKNQHESSGNKTPKFLRALRLPRQILRMCRTKRKDSSKRSY